MLLLSSLRPPFIVSVNVNVSPSVQIGSGGPDGSGEASPTAPWQLLTAQAATAGLSSSVDGVLDEGDLQVGVDGVLGMRGWCRERVVERACVAACDHLHSPPTHPLLNPTHPPLPLRSSRPCSTRPTLPHSPTRHSDLCCHDIATHPSLLPSPSQVLEALLNETRRVLHGRPFDEAVRAAAAQASRAVASGAAAQAFPPGEGAEHIAWDVHMHVCGGGDGVDTVHPSPHSHPAPQPHPHDSTTPPPSPHHPHPHPPGSADVSGDDRPPREVPLVKLAPAVAGAASLALEQPADLVAAVAALPEVAGLARSLYDGRPL